MAAAEVLFIRRQLLLRLRAARDELGRWPASREWDRKSIDHVSSRSYARISVAGRRGERCTNLGRAVVSGRRATGQPSTLHVKVVELVVATKAAAAPEP